MSTRLVGPHLAGARRCLCLGVVSLVVLLLQVGCAWWRENWWKELGEPVIVFGGYVYTYATVPGLADGWGRQPVVEVNTYEFDGPLVMPVASNVDRFFDSYSRYLETLVADSRYQKSGEKELMFPWDATEILARDEQLVELMRTGRFDSLMKNVDDVTRRWAAKVMGTRV